MFVIISIAMVIILLYVIISHLVFKQKLNIEEKRLHPFTKNRNKRVLIIEVITIIAFVVTGMVFISISDPSHNSPFFIPKLITLLLSILEIIRGVELWICNRADRSYYYQFLGALMFFMMFLLFHFSEGYL